MVKQTVSATLQSCPHGSISDSAAYCRAVWNSESAMHPATEFTGRVGPGKAEHATDARNGSASSAALNAEHHSGSDGSDRNHSASTSQPDPRSMFPIWRKKKPVTSASPIWQSADRKGLRRSLICPEVIISSRWACRSDRCSTRGRAAAVAEAGTAFRAIAIRAVAQPHEVIDKSSLSSTPSYERPYPTRFRASFLHLSLR